MQKDSTSDKRLDIKSKESNLTKRSQLQKCFSSISPCTVKLASFFYLLDLQGGKSLIQLESLKLSKLLLLFRERQMVLIRTRQGGPGRRRSLDLVHRSTPKVCAKGHCITPTLHYSLHLLHPVTST